MPPQRSSGATPATAASSRKRAHTETLPAVVVEAIASGGDAGTDPTAGHVLHTPARPAQAANAVANVATPENAAAATDPRHASSAGVVAAAAARAAPDGATALTTCTISNTRMVALSELLARFPETCTIYPCATAAYHAHDRTVLHRRASRRSRRQGHRSRHRLRTARERRPWQRSWRRKRRRNRRRGQRNRQRQCRQRHPL